MWRAWRVVGTGFKKLERVGWVGGIGGRGGGGIGFGGPSKKTKIQKQQPIIIKEV